mmetsp:Transcript_21738/g.84790  ORF Transcript_21738/g.84790 Transcript_21738/m.84790 type:complete len:285 (-) Transcript_21738:7414-8268(-)
MQSAHVRLAPLASERPGPPPLDHHVREARIGTQTGRDPRLHLEVQPTLLRAVVLACVDLLLRQLATGHCRAASVLQRVTEEEPAPLRPGHQVDRGHAHRAHEPRRLALQVGLQLHAQLERLLVVVADDVDVVLAAAGREVEQFSHLRVLDREMPQSARERRRLVNIRGARRGHHSISPQRPRLPAVRPRLPAAPREWRAPAVCGAASAAVPSIPPTARRPRRAPDCRRLRDPRHPVRPARPRRPRRGRAPAQQSTPGGRRFALRSARSRQCGRSHARSPRIGSP